MRNDDPLLARWTEGDPVPLSRLVDSPDAVERLRASTAGEKDPKYFGLTAYPSPSADGKFGYYVGIGRLPEAPNCALHVSARQFQAPDRSYFQIDYVRTYALCAQDQEVSRHLGDCLTVYADEAPIEVVDDIYDWSPLIALAYIKALHVLVQRNLRRSFITREEKLRGRVRGQVGVGRYVVQSILRGHPETVPCRFQSLEYDTLENRILRVALVGARRFLDRQMVQNLGDWRTWARQADAALGGVTVNRIEPRDFQAARKTGAYRHYASPLALAKAVLTRVGFDPNQPLERNTVGSNVKMIPFRLATAELFERYVEVRLRGIPDAKIKAGYSRANLGKRFLIRPDFLLSSGERNFIVDAKYKNLSQQFLGNSFDSSLRSDAYQVLAYSQNRDVQAWFGANASPTTVILCYPTPESIERATDPKLEQLTDLVDHLRAYVKDIYFDFIPQIALLGMPIPTEGCKK